MSKIGSVIGMCVTTIFIILSWVAISQILNIQSPICANLTTEPIIYNIPIYSVEDNTAISGTFFLGCGRINTKLVYIYYTGDDVNGFQRQMIDSTNVYIFRDTDKPYIIKKIKYVMTPMPPISACLPNDMYEIHVPKDTLIKEM